MRKLVLATTLMAGTALGGAAFAAGAQEQASGQQPGYQDAQQAQQMQGQPSMGMGQEAQIQLQDSHIREIQQALQDEGQDVSVDGVWGSQTAQALQQFQQEQGLDASGELNFATLDALGVDVQQLAQIETQGSQAAEMPGDEVRQQPLDQQVPGEGALPGVPGRDDAIEDQSPGQQ